jgi:retron-type reverse transcriptase
MKKIFNISYNDIISVENLLEAWKEFLSGKKGRKDVQEFERNLMENIISLHNDLLSRTYIHSNYIAFNISDPKPRNIHKVFVRDRLLHHALYRVLYSPFNKTFIHDSYSCRFGKGTHRSINRFRSFAYKISKNHTRTIWILKCDIRKFFASIDQEILLDILKKHITDPNIILLLIAVVRSFYSMRKGVGLPLGNLTSQLLVNIYMNEFDQWIKHKMKAKYYARYADDFVVLSEDKDYLLELMPKIGDFLEEYLRLSLHPNKIFIKTIASGVDFLGWIHFPNHRVLRTTTKNKMFRKIKEKGGKKETVQSYLGLLKHGNTTKLQKQVDNLI